MSQVRFHSYNYLILIQQFQHNDQMDSSAGGSQPSDRFHKPKSSTKQLQLHVASVYSQIAQMISSKDDLDIEMPTEVPTAVERVTLIKNVLAYLLDRRIESETNKRGAIPKDQDQELDQQNSGTKIACTNCEVYEKNLQKLEGEIRNHIRTHQQLKLYQDGLQQKIEEFKKEKKEFEKKYDTLKKKYEQAKSTMSVNMEKMSKLEQSNEKLKLELKQLKSPSLKAEQPRKMLNRHESNKQNFSEWRNSNFIEKQRVSIEKRPQSTERARVSVNVRSTKGIPISSKIVQEKAKEEKVKVLKNRLGF